jgi:hypothetical protein
MTNAAGAIKVLITYAICIPLAIFVGYLLCNPLDYGTLGFLGLVMALIISPVFIKWHYPLLVFGVGCPAYAFFLIGDPPVWQVITILSLGIAIVERAMNSEKRFISVPSMTWPLLFTAVMAYITAQLTGGIGLHALGGDVGGGRKYITLFIGIAMFFALTSMRIPKEKRRLYVGLFFLSSAPAFISDLFPVLPAPLNYINLLFPPTYDGMSASFSFGLSRLGAFAATALAVTNYMLARYGLRGIFLSNYPWRIPLLALMLILTLMGGYRILMIGDMAIIGLLFFLEGLHRTKLLLIFAMGMVLGGALLVPFSNKLPYTFQRAMSFLPLNWEAQAKMDAEGSAEWRYAIWRATWPKVPEHLLLGKGYALSAEDYSMMGDNIFANGAEAQMDAGNQALAISSDYHSGPLSTLMPFGIWGAISILSIMLAALRIQYRNFKYGDLELKTVNGFLLAATLWHAFGFFFVFGGYNNDVGDFAKYAGFSVALNWGVCGPKREAATSFQLKPVPQPQPA